MIIPSNAITRANERNTKDVWQYLADITVELNKLKERVKRLEKCQ